MMNCLLVGKLFWRVGKLFWQVWSPPDNPIQSSPMMIVICFPCRNVFHFLLFSRFQLRSVWDKQSKVYYDDDKDEDIDEDNHHVKVR